MSQKIDRFNPGPHALDRALEHVTDTMASGVLIAAARHYSAAFELDPNSEDTKAKAIAFLAVARDLYPTQRTPIQRAVALGIGAVLQAFPKNFEPKRPRSKKGKR